MYISTAKEMSKRIGLTWRGDFLESLSDYEKNVGYIKFNIPNPETPNSLNGEGVWGWMAPEDKRKYDDDSFTGKLPVILCNYPTYYSGILIAGQELVVRCNGGSRPILDPDWVHEHLADVYKDIVEIEKVATQILENCMDDYSSRIWEKIGESVIEDVISCSDIGGRNGFSKCDVSLAVGRAICDLAGIEV